MLARQNFFDLSDSLLAADNYIRLLEHTVTWIPNDIATNGLWFMQRSTDIYSDLLSNELRF